MPLPFSAAHLFPRLGNATQTYHAAIGLLEQLVRNGWQFAPKFTSSQVRHVIMWPWEVPSFIGDRRTPVAPAAIGTGRASAAERHPLPSRLQPSR
jgi:hypothetical protein